MNAEPISENWDNVYKTGSTEKFNNFHEFLLLYFIWECLRTHVKDKVNVENCWINDKVKKLGNNLKGLYLLQKNCSFLKRRQKKTRCVN